jgi:hypothetical protein
MTIEEAQEIESNMAEVSIHLEPLDSSFLSLNIPED